MLIVLTTQLHHFLTVSTIQLVYYYFKLWFKKSVKITLPTKCESKRMNNERVAFPLPEKMKRGLETENWPRGIGLIQPFCPSYANTAYIIIINEYKNDSILNVMWWQENQ